MNKYVKRVFFGNEKHLERKSYIWVMLGSSLYAVSSAVFLIIVTRMAGTEQAGIFSFGYSIAQLLLIIGDFSVRTFQSTDLAEKYSFKEYFSARIISVGLMIMVAILFALVNGYYLEKSVILIMLTFLKGFDAFSDVFEGEYQQKKRIDLSGKTLFIKIFFSMFFFAIGFYITRNLIITVSIQCVLLFLITMTVDIPAVSEFTVFTVSFKIKRLISLFLDCFPLFINAFLFVFIYTFPKYIVDRNFPPEYQTFYNILFMPALIFNLLRAFMMNPVLTKLMQFWSDGNVKEFESELKKQVLLLMCLFIPVFIFGYFIGIPVLNLVYGVHLNEYKNMFIVFLCGGCLNALAMIFLNLGVIFRKQRDFMTGCIFTAIGSAFFTYLFVLKLNFEGAAWAYLASTFMLCVVFAVLVIYNVQKYSRV